MKPIPKTILILSSLFPVPCSLFPVPSASAAVTLKWTVETSRLQPAVFDVVRGETLNLEAAFQSYGKPLSMAAKPCAIFYQTNGMGSAWWTAPATVRTAAALSGSSTNAVTNVVAATFTTSMDPGATVINGFLGSTGDIYRAAFTLRYRHGPGAAPNALEPPAKITAINWSTVYNSNVESAPFVVKGGSGGLTPQDAGNIATNSIDAKVAAWALKPNPAPVTDLTPAINYTTAVSNTLETAVSGKADKATTLSGYGISDAISLSGGSYSISSPISINNSLSEGNYFYIGYLYISDTDIFPDGMGIVAHGGWDQYRADYLQTDQQTLPEYLSTLDWHPSNALLSGYGITNAYTKTEADEASTKSATCVYYSNVTGDVENISADVATNAATSVVSNYLDYALAPLTGTTVQLASGEIGNLSLTSEQTALTVNLDFSAAADRSGDCMLYLINEADTDMTVGPSSVITIGWDGADIKAGTNVVMFTRMKREGDNSLVMVSTKEIK